jgi:hypothetical protein
MCPEMALGDTDMMAGICRLGTFARAMVAASGIALATASGALAGPIGDKATEAENLIAAGDAAGSLAAFDAATEAYWAASPLQFRAALFADNVTAFGKYEARANNTFRAGDTLQIYLEPVGYGFATDGDGFRVSFSAGIEIRKGDVILGKTDDLGTFGWQGRTKSREVHAAVSVGLPSLSPGDYQLLLTLNDPTSGKSATTTLPFTVAE